MRTRPFNSEVFFPDESIVTVTRDDVALLREKISTAPRGRMRLCAHQSVEDPLHEMLIVLDRETYIRPHKHPGKSESFHVIEGLAEVVLFDEQGGVARVIPLGDYTSGRCFFYRLAEERHHTIVIRSQTLIVHETTNGPFRCGDTVFAPWAPVESDAAACAAYQRRLREMIDATA